MKKVRCKKEFGVWYYEKTGTDFYNELDAPIYTLYNAAGEYVNTFGSYGDMKLYIETGIIYA